MGLPKINIVFSSKATSAVLRSSQGHVALVLRDETASPLASLVAYKNVTEVQKTDWTTENYDLITKVFLGTPAKVTILKISLDAELNDILVKLTNTGFNYLAIPQATTEEKELVASWIKPLRKAGKVLGKAVLANHKADSVSVVNFTTDEIETATKTYTTDEYTARMAGIFAGLSMTRSGTYFVLNEVISIKEKEDNDASVDAGELILINDGKKIKIGRAVNSLTTTGEGIGEDWKKIKIIDTHDLVHKDIRETFEDKYIGQVNNVYDNQILFIASVNAYFKALENEGALDNRAENICSIDIEAQRLAWESIGIDVEGLDDAKIREKSFGSQIFLQSTIKPVDALEDMELKVLV